MLDQQIDLCVSHTRSGKNEVERFARDFPEVASRGRLVELSDAHQPTRTAARHAGMKLRHRSSPR
jgi:hypothetical protein